MCYARPEAVPYASRVGAWTHGRGRPAPPIRDVLTHEQLPTWVPGSPPDVVEAALLEAARATPLLILDSVIVPELQGCFGEAWRRALVRVAEAVQKPIGVHDRVLGHTAFVGPLLWSTEQLRGVVAAQGPAIEASLGTIDHFIGETAVHHRPPPAE